MATYEVSTWSELIARMADTTLETRTIKLIADIDCNDEVPFGPTSSIDIVGSMALYCTIDGSYTENGVTKNHVIRNLRTNVTSPVDIFNFRAHNPQSGQSDRFKIGVTIQNIDFVNTVLNNARMFRLTKYEYGAGGNTVKFKNCSFVGRRNRYLIGAISIDENSLTFESCFFNIPYKPSDTSSTYVPLTADWSGYAYANYCRFRESYNGWTIGTYEPGISTNPQTSTYNLKLNGCYIDGTIVGHSSNICITKQYSYDAAIQNVVDADLRAYNNSGSETVSIFAPKGIYKTAANGTTPVVKKYNDDTVNCSISNQNTSAIPEIPSKMTNPTLLAADGFDIIIPE